MFGNINLAVLIARMVVLLLAFTLHELAHAVTADRLGDPTARRMGRITLNPIRHLDPFGTIMLLISGFGWAKPVMVNPYNLQGNPKTSMAIVSAAGPVTNMLLAVIFALPVRLGLVGLAFSPANAVVPDIPYLLFQLIWINIILALFNLIPVPPLDGSKILFAILPDEMARQLRWLEQYGFLILLAVVFLVPQVLNALIGQPSAAILMFLIGR